MVNWARVVRDLDRLEEAVEDRDAAHASGNGTAYAASQRLVAAAQDRLEESLPSMAKCKKCGMKGKPGGKCANGHQIPMAGKMAEATLTADSRKALPKSDFVFPADKRYPIHDASHAANALARASGKPEYDAVKKKVCARYPALPACKAD